MIITTALVIFMILVFILLFLFIRTIDHRWWLTLLVSIILTPMVYFYMFYPFLNIVSSYHHQKHFSASSWTEQPALRFEMIEHTITSDTLIGLDKKEIKGLLGKYEWLSWDATNNEHNPNKWNYGTGIKPGAFNDKTSNLEITFKNDTVSHLNAYNTKINFDDEDETP